MTRAEMLALAERCEQAAGPDRELDAQIWLAVTPGATRRELRGIHKATGREQVIDETRDASHRLIIIPSNTASLDAAMELVPEGALWEIEYKVNTGPRDSGTFLTPEGEPGTDFRAGCGIGEVPTHWEYGRSFATPALALCAAALKARAGDE